MPAANVQRAGCAGWDCLTIYKRPTYVIMTYDPVNPDGSYRLWCWVLLMYSSTYSSWSGWAKVLCYFFHRPFCNRLTLHCITLTYWTALNRVSHNGHSTSQDLLFGGQLANVSNPDC